MSGETRFLSMITKNPEDNIVIDIFKAIAIKNGLTPEQLLLIVIKIFIKEHLIERRNRDIPGRSPGSGEAEGG